MGEKDLELEGPILEPRQMIDLVALIWFYLANRRLRQTMNSGSERRMWHWTNSIGIRDDIVISRFREFLAEHKPAMQEVACAIGDHTCPEWPCYLFLKPDAMIAILDRMREVIRPGFESAV